MFRNKRLRYVSLMVASALAGCQTTGQFAPPGTDLPDHFTTGSIKSVPNRFAAWWTQIADNELRKLIYRGLSNNLDIEKAIERIAVARSGVRIAGADGLPQIDLGGTAQTLGSNPSSATSSTPIQSLGLNVSWLLDFNGKIAKQKSASEAALRAAGFDLGSVRLAYLADLIATYIDMNYYKQAIAVTEGSIKNAEETLSLIRNMKQLGTANELEIVQTEGDLATLRSSLPAIERDRIIAENHLATLIGEPAGSVHLTGNPKLQPVLGTEVEPGVPADLIRNRPDLRAKEQLLYAAVERIGVTRADLLPTVTLAGSIDAAFVQGVTGGIPAATWAFASSVIAPVVDGGRRRATVDIAETECRIRYLEWKQNVLAAVEEVENLLTSIKRGQRELASLHESAAANEKSLSLSREAMAGGTGILLTVLDAQRSLNRSRLALALSQRQLARYQLSLRVAVGTNAVIDPTDLAMPAPTPVIMPVWARAEPTAAAPDPGARAGSALGAALRGLGERRFE
jgi:outer membrane protein, multidrug efflux system